MTQRYDTYKDSGVQWLEEIPEHWGTRRAKYLLKLLTESTKRTRKIGLENIESNTGKLILTESIFDGDGVDFDCGDILYGKLRPYLNKVWLAEFDGNAVGDFYVYRAINDYLNSFAKYLLLSSCFVGISNASTYGAKMPRVSSQFIHSLHFPLPPLSEQRSIVSFLDAKCGKIDEWVTKKQKEVEHLQEMKQRVIADAVTRGLNPHVKMKATNIPWLKEIPEHWEIKPIRAILRENTDKTETGDEELLSLSQYTGISRKKDAAKIGMFEAESTVGYKKVHPGQFVMNIMLAWNGSYAVSEFEGIISPAYCVFDFISKDEKMYYNYLWRLSMYQGAFKTESRGIIDSRLRLYPSKFLPFPTICPPLSEQRSIVSYLDAKCSKIDKLIVNITKEIECIKEYKQRLISDVATGQIKVC